MDSLFQDLRYGVRMLIKNPGFTAAAVTSLARGAVAFVLLIACASQRNVLALVLRQGMAMALGGSGIGLVAAYALTHLLTGLLFEVSPADPLTFAGITLLLLGGIALFASYLPAIRATTKVGPNGGAEERMTGMFDFCLTIAGLASGRKCPARDRSQL